MEEKGGMVSSHFQMGEISEAVTPTSRPWKRGLGTRSNVRPNGTDAMNEPFAGVFGGQQGGQQAPLQYHVQSMRRSTLLCLHSIYSLHLFSTATSIHLRPRSNGNNSRAGSKILQSTLSYRLSQGHNIYYHSLLGSVPSYIERGRVVREERS
jgi:hypothetical protein